MQKAPLFSVSDLSKSYGAQLGCLTSVSISILAKLWGSLASQVPVNPLC